MWRVFSPFSWGPPLRWLRFGCALLFPSDWSHWLAVIKDCHLIQRLTVDFSNYRRRERQPATFPAMRVILTALTHLEFWETVGHDASGIDQFLSCCDVPNLVNLVIRNVIRNGQLEGLYRVLVSLTLIIFMHTLALLSRHPAFPV